MHHHRSHYSGSYSTSNLPNCHFICLIIVCCGVSVLCCDNNTENMSFQQELASLTEQISELKSLTEIAKLDSVKTLLNAEINRLSVRKSTVEKELEKAQKQLASDDELTKQVGIQLGVISVNNYMWDQSNEHLKLYIEVDKSYSVDPSQISLKFTNGSNFTCIFGKYRFTLGRLYKAVNTEKSNAKITKSNRLIITLYKVTPGNWPSLQVQDSQLKPPIADKDDKDELADDPSAGLMKLMKNMYDQGDDEMKRTIMKSWYESQQKKDNFEL